MTTTEKKEKAITVWDIVTDLSKGKQQIIRTSEAPHKEWKKYNVVLVNKGFSFFQDTIMIANKANQMWELPVHMQHDFYMMEVRPKNRFQKWPAKKESELLELVCNAYGINKDKAWDVLALLSEEQIAQIRKLHNKGGRI